MTDQEISQYAVNIGIRCEVSSWMDLKKILLVSLPSSERSRFSTRDPATKLQVLNNLEAKIVDDYREKTGTRLELPQ